MKERGFLAVEIFGFSLANHTTAKRDAISLIVEDWEDDAIEEAVVWSAPFIGSYHIGIYHFLYGVAF